MIVISVRYIYLKVYGKFFITTMSSLVNTGKLTLT